MNKSAKTLTKLALLATIVGIVAFFTANNATAYSANDGAGFEVASFDAKCGGDEKKAAKEDSGEKKAAKKESKCGEGKCGEGKCGGDEKKAAKKESGEKKAAKKEAKCGEGKCGEGKCG